MNKRKRKFELGDLVSYKDEKSGGVMKKYTLKEAEEFLKGSQIEHIIENEYDSCSNNWCTEVRLIDGKFYLVSFCNNALSPVRPKKNTEEDWYEFTEVFPEKRMVEITEWKVKA